MAVDEALLKLSFGGGQPVLRFFSWEKPSLSIGSFQDADEVDTGELKLRDIPLVRRPTGGRAVLHDSELTYSVACPIPSEFFPSDLMGSYRVIGACFLEALGRLGVEASLVPVTKNPDRKRKKCAGRDPLCFSSPSWYEVLADGKKLIGSAQRRLKGAFLQQGSLMTDLDIGSLTGLLRYPDGESRTKAAYTLASKMTSLHEHTGEVSMDKLKASVAAGFEEVLGMRLAPSVLTAEETELAEKLMEEKYSTEDWNLHRQVPKDLA